jgi:hypothetical protein
MIPPYNYNLSGSKKSSTLKKKSSPDPDFSPFLEMFPYVPLKSSFPKLMFAHFWKYFRNFFPC